MGVCIAGSDNLVRFSWPSNRASILLTWSDWPWPTIPWPTIRGHIMDHIFFRVSLTTFHQTFKSIGEVFSMTFPTGKFGQSDSLSGDGPCRPEPPRANMTVIEIITDLEFQCTESEHHSTQVKSTMKPPLVSDSDWSSNLISPNLIRRSNWNLNYFWKLFLNLLSFLHMQIKFIVREFYWSMLRSRDPKNGHAMTRGHFKELWSCQESGIAVVLRTPRPATSCWKHYLILKEIRT